MVTTTAATRRARALRLVRAGLAALVVLGFGAAATAGAWRDDVSAAATAQASSFDIWSRFDTTAASDWQDVGLLGGGGDTWNDGSEVILVPIADALPGTNYVRKVRLCNAGSVDGQIVRATLTSNNLLVDTKTIEIEGMDAPLVNGQATGNAATRIPANSCPPSPKGTEGEWPTAIQGDIHFTTTTNWTTAQYGKSDRIVIKIWVESV